MIAPVQGMAYSILHSYQCRKLICLNSFDCASGGELQSKDHCKVLQGIQDHIPRSAKDVTMTVSYIEYCTHTLYVLSRELLVEIAYYITQKKH